MVFSSKISKFGKGDNISLYIKDPNKILIYYFKDGIMKKELNISKNKTELVFTNETFPYNEVIQISNFLITRIDKNIGIKELWKIKFYL